MWLDGNTEDAMLTTTDNPFNPFTHFNEWDKFDKELGYYTCAYIARVTRTSDELSDKDQQVALSQAMKEILEFNLSGRYIMVTEESFVARDNGVID